MMLASGDLERCVHVMDTELGPMDELGAICRSGIQEEAFYVCDMDAVVAKYQLWQKLLPRVHPHYAVKCNDTRVLISTLAALGAGFDCASMKEIEIVVGLGVDSSRIIFAHPSKSVGHIRRAAALRVDLTTFDNEAELHKLKALHPKARLVLRIRCDDEGATVCLGEKFGCDAVKEAPRLLRAAKGLGLSVVGVSFHVGSGCSDPLTFRRAIEMARSAFDVGRDLGFVMTLLDIGGGYPGDDDVAFAKIANVVNASLDELFPSGEVTVISEPGSFLATSAFTLAANVHSKREIVGDNGDITNVMYFINDGVYGSFFDVMLNRVFRGEPLEGPREASNALLPSSVWGPTCDSMDRVEAEAALPLLEVGSWLLYRNMGAYTRSLASNFNGFPVPKVHAVISRNTWIQLRERAPLSEYCFLPSVASGILRLHVLPACANPITNCRRNSQIDQPDHANLTQLLTSE